MSKISVTAEQRAKIVIGVAPEVFVEEVGGSGIIIDPEARKEGNGEEPEVSVQRKWGFIFGIVFQMIGFPDVT